MTEQLEIKPRLSKGYGGYWRWDCPVCFYGDLFLTRDRCQESIDTHLRVVHKQNRTAK
jgi:hypothetical protein